MTTFTYALMTAAYNEERLIGRTIESVLAQTVGPARWVIVSDGSTDRTDEIVAGYCARHPFIRLLRVENLGARGVIRKVNALNLAYRDMSHLKPNLIGNLDADVSFDVHYFATLLRRFQLDVNLGISGGLIYEESGGKFRSRMSNTTRSVAHAAQLVRRDCYEEIGGYLPLKYGGEDWCAEVKAKMKGWTVKAFADLKVMHHRPTGGADRLLHHRYREGKMDFSLGSHPLFEFLKCVRRVPEQPVGIGALTRLAGFWHSYLQRQPKEVSSEFEDFLRNEQKRRLTRLWQH